MAVTKLQISPVIVNGFENGFHQWIQRIFLVVVDAKKLFSEFFLKIWIHFAALLQLFLFYRFYHCIVAVVNLSHTNMNE